MRVGAGVLFIGPFTVPVAWLALNTCLFESQMSTLMYSWRKKFCGVMFEFEKIKTKDENF